MTTHDHTLRRLLVSKGFSDQQAAEILDCGSWMEVPPAARLFSQDDPTPYLAFIESGEVTLIIKPPSQERPIQVTSLGQGRMIGWEPLVGARRCTFEVLTVTHTRLFVVSTARLELLRKHEPETAVQLLNLALATMQAVEQAGRELPYRAARSGNPPSAEDGV